MTQQERIELLNRELQEIGNLLTGIGECEVIPSVLLKMAQEKALRLAEGIEKLGASPVEKLAVASVKEPSVVACPEEVQIKVVSPQPEPQPESQPEAQPKPEPEPVKVQPMPVKEAFEQVYREFTQTPVQSAPKSDLRSLMTLNDRFLFQRELFRGDIGMLNYTLDEVNKLATIEEALAFIDVQYHWDAEASGVKEFFELLERHFKGTII
ncbi:MAG: hypothetical protein RR346_02635 [Bacteroidales bacterium]